MPEKPNVIIVNCDDLGYGDIGCYGSEKHRTPAIDRMASEGIRFTDFYMSASVCTPSRASLLTGCYPKRIGFSRFVRDGREDEVVLFPGDCYGLNPREKTIASILKEQGYSTMLIGKWHCGDQQQFLPTNFGFDSYFGIPYSNDMGINTLGEEKINNLNYDRVLSHPPLPLLKDKQIFQEQPDQANLTDKYAEEAVKFIRDNKDGSFFLYLAHMYVHLPIYAPERFLKNSKNGPYGAAVEHIDQVMEVIFDELRSCGIDNDTIVMFTSDNGSPEIMGGSNEPLKGRKRSCWEGGFRVPCIMRWPEKIKAGRVSGDPVTVMDFLPTIASIAGAEVPNDRIIDGRDIGSIITGNDDREYKALPFYYYHNNNLYAARSGDWKYFTDSPDYPEALYDLREDIAETTDLKDRHPGIVKDMKKLLSMARIDMGDDLEVMDGENIRPCGRELDPKPLTNYDPDNPYIIAEYDMTCILDRLRELTMD